MYPSEVEYQILDYFPPIPESFLQTFVQSFSAKDSENNHAYLEILNENCDTIIFLLQMIKEGLIDKKQEYSSLLSVIFPYLNKIVNENQDMIKELFEKNPAIPETLLQTTILFLLPYAAQAFQDQNNINNFNLLLSCFLSISGIDLPIYYSVFNNYINFLLTNPQNPPQQLIIAMYFAGNLYNMHIEENNIQILIQIIQEKIQLLGECNRINNINCMIYKTIFIQLAQFLADSVISESIPRDLIFKSILNFIHLIKSKYQDQNELEDENDFSILNSIFNFLNVLFGRIAYYELKEIEDFAFFFDDVYHLGTSLANHSNFGSSQQLIQFIYDNITYLIIDPNDQEELNYFVYFINVLSSLPKSVIEEIKFSQESFFFDNFEIEFNQQSFTQRQYVAKFLKKIYNNEITEPLIQALLQSLCETDIKSIKENHMFIISQLIRIIYEENENDQIDEKYENILHDISAKFIPYVSEFVDSLINSTNCFRSPTQSCNIFSYYYFINNAFYVLENTEIGFLNDEINSIFSIIQNEDSNEFGSLLFTFLCITSYNLLSRDQLKIEIGQIFPFIATNSSICLTNHANMFVVEFAEKTKNYEFLLQIFDNYILQCENLFQELIQISEKNQEGFYIVPEEVKQSKDYSYKIGLCADTINQISKIIHMIDEFPYEEEKLLDLIYLLTNYEKEWEFSNEEVFLVSEIMVKAPDVKIWTKFYIDNIRDSGKMQIYGEWVIPLIYLVSYATDLIDDELYAYFFEEIEKFLNSVDIKRYIDDSADFIMLLNFFTRLFELGFIDEKVKIPQELLSFFFNFVDTIPSIPEICPDYDPLNHRISAILLKISAILAGYQIQETEFHDFLTQIVNENLIINDILRFLIIVLIDNFVSKESYNELAQLRKMCLNNSIPKNEVYLENYCNNPASFFQGVPHPIMKYRAIEGFISTICK